MIIKWIGPSLDHSGYGEANRNYIKALYDQGVKIKVVPWLYQSFSADFYGELGTLIKNLEFNPENDKDYDIIIHHYVPNEVKSKYEENKINVGFSTWETDILPTHWVEYINKYFNAQIVPSEYNKNIYIKSGIKVPVYIVPHTIDIKTINNIYRTQKTQETEFFNKYKNKFKFISTFQWIKRKNPKGLLKAYLTEFNPEDDVILILRTYGMNESKYEYNKIKGAIKEIKKNLRLDKYPPIFLISKFIKKDDLLSLYTFSDCYVSTARSEGFGLPIAEACISRNVIISTNFGGQKEFLNKFFAKLLQYQMTPVTMEFGNYNGKMSWADPSICQLKEYMRQFYNEWKNNPKILLARKELAHTYVSNKLNFETIGKQYKNILERIYNENNNS